MEYGKLHPEAVGPNEAFGAPTTEVEQRDAVQALRSRCRLPKKDFWFDLGSVWVSCFDCGAAIWTCRSMGTSGSSGEWSACEPPATRPQVRTDATFFSGGQVIPTVVEMTDPIQGLEHRTVRAISTSQNHDTMPTKRLCIPKVVCAPAWHTWSQLRDHVKSTKVHEYSQRTRKLELGEPHQRRSRPSTVPGSLTDSDFLAALDEDNELHLSTAARPLQCTLPKKLGQRIGGDCAEGIERTRADRRNRGELAAD